MSELLPQLLHLGQRMLQAVAGKPSSCFALGGGDTECSELKVLCTWGVASQLMSESPSHPLHLGKSPTQAVAGKLCTCFALGEMPRILPRACTWGSKEPLDPASALGEEQSPVKQRLRLWKYRLPWLSLCARGSLGETQFHHTHFLLLLS